MVDINKPLNNNKRKGGSRKSQLAVCLFGCRPTVQSEEAEMAPDEPQALPDVSASVQRKYRLKKKTARLDIKRNQFICDVIFASLKVAEQKAGSCNERVTRSMAVNSPMLQFSPALTSMLRAVPSVLSPGQYGGR